MFLFFSLTRGMCSAVLPKSNFREMKNRDSRYRFVLRGSREEVSGCLRSRYVCALFIIAVLINLTETGTISTICNFGCFVFRRASRVSRALSFVSRRRGGNLSRTARLNFASGCFLRQPRRRDFPPGHAFSTSLLQLILI